MVKEGQYLFLVHQQHWSLFLHPWHSSAVPCTIEKTALCSQRHLCGWNCIAVGTRVSPQWYRRQTLWLSPWHCLWG